MSMTYRTEKVTVLRDWKLALMNMFLQLCVVSWVIYSLFDQKTYIESEVPTGVVSSWGLGGTEYTDKQVSIYNGQQSFCNNLVSYAFNYSADWYYKVPICVYYAGAELIQNYHPVMSCFSPHTYHRHSNRDIVHQRRGV